MIVQMRRVTVLCLDSDREQVLQTLYDMGVVHIDNVRDPSGDDVDRSAERLEEALAAVQAVRAASTPSDDDDAAPSKKRSRRSRSAEAKATSDSGRTAARSHDAPGTLLEEALRLRKEKVELERTLAELQTELARVGPLGDFDPSLVSSLRESGLFVTLLRSSNEVALGGPQDAVMEQVGSDERHRYYALVTRTPYDPTQMTPAGAATELSLPELRLAEINDQAEQRQRELDRVDSELAGLQPNLPELELAVEDLGQTAELARVRAGMGEDRKVSFLQGYVPAEDVPGVRMAAIENGWGLSVRAPEPTERVPTLLELPRWVKPIQVLFSFLRISPAYWETDVSVAFLIFFTLFVGLLIGDAGYGILVLLVAVLLTVQGRGIRSPAVTLLYVLSLSVILFGAMQGSWFGIENLPAALESLRVDWLSEQTNVMELCFFIGAVHMTLAHLWTGVIEFPRYTFLAQMGWVAIVWSMFFVARALVLDRPFPGWVIYMLAVGVVFVLLFLMPPSRIRQHIMEYVLLPLTLVGFFVDVISYIRLFAVGVATLAVSQSFNGMADSIGYDSVLTGIFAVIILIFGHTLNLVLCVLAVLVHGVRLNTLEFSAHKGLSWAGFSFRPFGRASRKVASPAG